MYTSQNVYTDSIHNDNTGVHIDNMHQQMYKGTQGCIHVINGIYIDNHIDRLSTESHQQCVQIKTYTT